MTSRARYRRRHPADACEEQIFFRSKTTGGRDTIPGPCISGRLTKSTKFRSLSHQLSARYDAMSLSPALFPLPKIVKRHAR